MPTLSLNKLIGLFLALFVPCLIALRYIDAGLVNATTPDGIVSFQLCAYSGSCQAALASWGADGQLLAMLSLGLDYAFMIAYAGLIFLCLQWVAERIPGPLARMTRLLAWLSLSAALADALENYGLIQLLLSQSVDFHADLAAFFATFKFLILGASLAWLLGMGIFHLVHKRRRATT